MLLNDRYDYINDFPLTQAVFDEYLHQKYGVLTGGTPYLETVYNTDVNGLMVDFQTDDVSIDVSGTFALTNISNPAQVEYRQLRSVTSYDDVIQSPVKVFLYTDMQQNGSWRVDPTQWRVNLGAVPNVKVVTAMERELKANAEKAQIRVVSREFLEQIITNFKELM